MIGGKTKARGERTDVLDNIVAKWIPNERESIDRDLSDQAGLLHTRRVINAALQNAASMPMSADGDTILSDRLEDELKTSGSEPQQWDRDLTSALTEVRRFRHFWMT